MKNQMETWYAITRWSGEVYETSDPEEARLSIREGLEVLKTTRVIFEQGPTLVRTTATTEIFKIKDV